MRTTLLLILAVPIAMACSHGWHDSPPIDKNRLPACILCEHVVALLEKALQNKSATNADALHLMHDGCMHLGGPLQLRCLEMVDEYGPRIARLVTDVQHHKKPLSICSEIGLCSTKISCPLCKSVVRPLQERMNGLGDDATMAEKRDMLRKFCGTLNPTLQSGCDQFLHQYGEPLLKILDELEGNVDPQVICAQLELCPKMAEALFERLTASIGEPIGMHVIHFDNRAEAAAAGMVCEMCKYFVGELEDHLPDPGNCTTEELEYWMKNLCEYVPPCQRGMCDSFMDKYAVPLLDIYRRMEEYEEPAAICHDLSLCQSCASSCHTGEPNYEPPVNRRHQRERDYEEAEEEMDGE
ncbi:hypothetical protein PAPYR_5417 [Paratrimastix pyriformis]|uniref:Saposin B-type domain-containing protein n=1 Tax=Paratrimastix pyriformis TaxID=342808 RepID=A0ABQ8UKX8_9EUKA|nr:hypothetical protein PAPYR_5417 [Paratrimastix pyriformis]